MIKVFLTLFVLLCIQGLWRWKDRFAPGVLRVVFFDVGQGDSALIRFPGGENWLVDAGGGWESWDRGQRDLFLELARYAVLELDVALLSHPDTDHGLGFRGLLGQIQIKQFLWNAAFDPKQVPLLAQLQILAIDHGAALRAVDETFERRVSGVQTRVTPIRAAGGKNEKPLALHLEYGGCTFLLAGDAQKNAEQVLGRLFPQEVDVLKVHHHGSKTSSTPQLLARWRPHWAIASLGADNRYGHPAKPVTRRFYLNATRFLRTDVHGAIEFVVSPDGLLQCYSAAGGCGKMQCR